MTTKEFIAVKIPKFCAIEWHLPPTYFTRPIVLKIEWFEDFSARDSWLKNHKGFWWERLPFVTRIYYVGVKGCDR